MTDQERAMKGTRSLTFNCVHAAPRTLLALTLMATYAAATSRAQAQVFECETEDERVLLCVKDRGDGIVCRTAEDRGEISIEELATCVEEHFDAGPNPVVTLAAFGGRSQPTERYKMWNGGTAITTHNLSTLQEKLGGRSLFYEVAYPLLDATGKFVYPGQATFVTTERVRSEAEIEKMDGENTLLVAGGGGAHGRGGPDEENVTTGQGGVGGYADGWSGRPCPYTANAVCADGDRGRHAGGALGGSAGTEEQTGPFVTVWQNGAESSSDGRYAWGGHGGAGHANGGGGDGEASVRPLAAGGGGGASLAWRSTRETPPAVEPWLLDQPGLQIFFHREGLQTEVEWMESHFMGGDFEPVEMKAADGTTSLSLTISEPGAEWTDIDLGGLRLVDRCSSESRRIEPYKLTRVRNLGTTFTTGDDSQLHYRIYDANHNLLATAQSKAAASLTIDETFQLFFVYKDETGNQGKLSVSAAVGQDGNPHRALVCPR